MSDNRPGWDDYFLGIARAVSKRADCTRRQVGAILVDQHNRHRGSGYNGGRSKGPSCLLGECPRGNSEVEPGSSYDTGAGTCVAIHAEQNLMLDTAPDDARHGKIYITDEPCDGCLRMLQGSGVDEIIWPSGIWSRFSPTEWTLLKRGKLTTEKTPVAAPLEVKRTSVSTAVKEPRIRGKKRPEWTPGSDISILEDDPL